MTEAPNVAFVTGGARGIGWATAEEFVRRNWRVTIGDVDLDEARRRAAGHPGAVLAVALDVADRGSVERAFAASMAHWGQLDAAVNNAGIQRHGALETLPFENWRAVLDVNLHGVFHCLQVAAGHMLTAGSGSIVNLASVAATRGAPGRAPYAASKAAIVSLTKTAAVEWAQRGVRVNAVAPGYVETDLVAAAVAEGRLDLAPVLERTPAHRLAQPAEIARAICSWPRRTRPTSPDTCCMSTGVSKPITKSRSFRPKERLDGRLGKAMLDWSGQSAPVVLGDRLPMRLRDDASRSSRADELVPIERVSVAEQVTRSLLDLIRSGGVRPGGQLPTERDLATTLGVSRTSVREALRGLQILGVVRSRQGGGVFVTSLDTAEFLQPLQLLITLTGESFGALHEARVAVEGAMGRLIGPRVDAATIERLRGMVEQQRHQIADPVAFRASDQEFHRVLGAASGNPFLDRISEALFSLGVEYRRVAWDNPGVLVRSVEDHAGIVDALETRDPDRIEAAMVRHIRDVPETTRAATDASP